MLWKERFRIRAVQMDNFGGLLATKRIDKMDERFDEGILRWRE